MTAGGSYGPTGLTGRTVVAVRPMAATDTDHPPDSTVANRGVA